KSHVAKIALKRNAVTAAQTGSPVSEEVPGKAYARAEVFPSRLPQAAAVGQIAALFHNSICELLVNVTRARYKIGVIALVLVMLHPVVFPAHAVIKGEPWEYLPAILGIQTAIFVAVTAAEIRGCCWTLQSAIRGLDNVAGSGVLVAGELVLRKDGGAEAIQITIQELVNHTGGSQ